MSESTNTLGQPSRINGWMAFSSDSWSASGSDANKGSSRSSPAVSPKSQRADPVQPAASTSSLTQQEKDELLLADPPRLTGAALLDLAERYSTADIVALANKAAKTMTLTRAAINSRLNTAVKKRAKELGQKKEEVRATFTEKRKARGVRSTRRVAQGAKNAAAATTAVESDEEESPNHGQMSGVQTEPAQQADVALYPGVLSDADARAKYGEADYLSFKQPNELFREKLLEMAGRYSNKEISAGICAMPQNMVLTENGVANRVHQALKERAKKTGKSLADVRAELNVVREANGVAKPNSHGKGYLRPPKQVVKRKRSVSETVDKQEKKSKVEQQDAEMAETGNEGSEAGNAQETETANTQPVSEDALEAAHTLLDLHAGATQPEADVVEAAHILMDLHAADTQLASHQETRKTIDESQVDPEMTESETEDAAEIADQVARFRDAEGHR